MKTEKITSDETSGNGKTRTHRRQSAASWMRININLLKLLRLTPGVLQRKMSNHQFLIMGAILVGLWAGLSAVILKYSVHTLQENLSLLSKKYPWIFLVSPLVGISLTYFFIKYGLQGNLSRGTYHVLHAIAKKSSRLSRKETYSHIISSALTVGMGGSAGLESPIVQTGSAVGSAFSSFFATNYRDRTLLLACGAAAGIATAFNAPIAGVLFALEVLLVDVRITAFIPLLLSGAIGALCSKIILSEGIPLSFRHIDDFDYHNIPFYILLGAACGIAAAAYIKMFITTERILKMKFKNDILRLVFGGALLGCLILFFPPLFGEGYASIKSLAVNEPVRIFDGSPLRSLFTGDPALLGLGILCVALAKVFAVSVTLNCGGNGGNFAPSLLVGACIGYSFALLFNAIGLANLPPENHCLVAMAGVLTGVFHAPLSAIFLIAEITGGYEMIIPLMIVAALSTAISRYLHPLSLDEAKLRLMDRSIRFDKDTSLMSELSLRQIVEKDFLPVNLTTNLRELVAVIARSKRNLFPVVDAHNTLVGIIALDDIRGLMFDASVYDTTTADQLMRQPIITINLGDDLATVMETFDKTEIWNIPVVENGKYIGFVSKSNLLTNYRKQLRST